LQVIGKEVGGQFRYGQLQEGHHAGRAAVVKAQFHPEIRAELQVADGVGPVVQQLQEGVEILGRRVVGTGGADHVDPLEIQFRLQRAQGVGLAGDADQRDAPVASGAGGFQQRQRRRVAHAHAARL
jgi:hypothetical protein